MLTLAECGRLTNERTRCDVCSRFLRCVYTVSDEGWTFFLGRRCYSKMMAFLEGIEGEPK